VEAAEICRSGHFIFIKNRLISDQGFLFYDM